ncbi:MAG TPA: sugar-binding protein, partial [Lentisphaeria bacterium]|nr:sugar-binding protein [Lentisphaeria bacterium]
MLNRLLASLLFLLLSSPALLQAMEPLRVNFQPSPPEINGRLDDPAWQNLPWNTGCFLLGTDQAPTAGVKYKLYHDQDQLYLGVELEEPAMDKVRQTEYSPGSTMLWLNDSLEINVVTDPNLLSFYKIMVDVAGAWVDMKAVDDNTDTGKYLLDLDWASGAEIKVARAENAWLVEAAIPFGALAFSATTEPAWRINLGRNRYAVTPPELSATSPIPVRSHVVPAAFRTAVIADFNPTRFQLDLDEVNFSFDKNADGQYEAMVSTVVHNNTGSFAILHLEARLRDCASNASVQANKLLTLPRNEYQKHSLTLHPAGPGQYELDLELYANASRRRLLKKATRLVAAEYQPLAITLHRPCYRNNLYATMPDKTIEAEISLREGTGKPLAVTLVGPGGEAARQDFAAAQATQRVQFDGASLPDGDYVLKAACKLDGRTLQSEVRIRKLPYLPNEVWFDQEGITHVDGKPFLPFGWYGT